jgi:hypothetical protein
MVTTGHATEADPKATHINVIVVYNGLAKTFTVPATQATRALLEQALHEFGIVQNAHIHSLFTADGVELADSQNLDHAGVVDGSRLLLRPSQIRGGAA